MAGTTDTAVPLTREQARAAYAIAGIKLSGFTISSRRTLERLIDQEMLSAGLMDGTLRMRDLGGSSEYLRCSSFHFDDREAVSFNRDGFVGFAGWADEHNIQPILRGFMAWLAEQDLATFVNDITANVGLDFAAATNAAGNPLGWEA